MSSTTFNLKNINFMSESKYDSLTEIHDDELYAVKFDINSCNLLDFKWSDHILNDMSWVRADTFSWQSGDLYKSAYQHLVEDYNSRISNSNGTAYYAWYSADSSYDDGLVYTLSENPNDGYEVYRPSNGTHIWAGDIHYVFDDNTISVDGKVEYTRSAENDILPDAYTETIGSQTITYYLAEDGHKIVLPDMESTVQSIYEESGVAWYYVLDVTNKLFKLPRTKFGFTGLRDAVGNYVAESLPNLKGTVYGSRFGNGNLAEKSGVFSQSDSSNYSPAGSSSSGDISFVIRFNANDSSSTYQDNAPVQQRATQMYLYFYVGQFTQTATEQTAGLNAELFNGKLDLDAGNATQTTKETLVGWGVPDWASVIKTTTGTTGFEAPTDGFVVFARGNSQTPSSISINGSDVYPQKRLYVEGTLLVAKGDVLKDTASGNIPISFAPLKGVNNA